MERVLSALDDIRTLREAHGTTAESIDWDRVFTINYRSYVEPDAVVIDVGAGRGLQSRRLRRYRKPAKLFLVERNPKQATKLRFEFSRKRDVVVVQVALGAETATDGGGTDRLDDWTLPGRLAFLRIGAGPSWVDVIDGAGDVLRRDRPIVAITVGDEPGHALDPVIVTHELTVVDLFGNVVDPDEIATVAAFHPALVLVPNELAERMAPIRDSIRTEALRSIQNYRPIAERLKRIAGY